MARLPFAVQRAIDDRAHGQTLTESERRFRSLFENLLNGYAYCRMIYDDAGEAADFVYLDVNPAFERLTGLKDAVGRPVSEVIPGIGELSPELFEVCGRVARSGIPETIEFDFKSQGKWLFIAVYSTEPSTFGDVFEHGDERRRFGAVDRDEQPLALRLEVELDRLGYAAARDAAADLEQLRAQLPDSGDDLRNRPAHRVLETRQALEGWVDVEVDEIGRLSRIVIDHPAIGVAVEEVLEQRAEAPLALRQRLPMGPVVDGALHGERQARHPVFEHAVVGAVLKQFDGRLLADGARDADERRARARHLGQLQRPVGVESGQSEVGEDDVVKLSLIHISEPTRLGMISY